MKTKINLPLYVVLVSGIFFSGLLWYGVRIWQRQLVVESVAQVTDSRMEILNDRVLAATTALHSLASFVRLRPNMTREEFSSFVGDLLSLQGGVDSLSWNPRVTRAQVPSLESTVRAEGFPRYSIEDYVRDGVTAPAANRSEYFPCEFIDPWRANERALGFDPTSEPRRRSAFMEARDLGLGVATAPVQLIQEAPGERGILMAEPVFSGDPVNEAQRQSQLRGFAVAVFRLRDLVSSALLPLAAQGLSVSVRDEGSGTFIFQQNLAGKKILFHWPASLSVGQRHWIVDFMPTASFHRPAADWESWETLAMGLSLTYLISVYFWQRAGKDALVHRQLLAANQSLAHELEVRRATEADLLQTRADLEERVLRRTAQLKETNQALENEVKVRIEAEAAAEDASAAKSEFLAIVSHEIRSPVGGMMRLLNLMLEDRKDPKLELSSELQVLHNAAGSLYRLADELLSLGRVEAVGVELHVATIHLAPFLEDLRRLFQPTAELKGLYSRLVVAPNVPAAFRSDPLPLRQILANLLSNAFKFTTQGGVVLSVDLGTGATAGKIRMIFTVTDTGIGIAPENLNNLFQPYRQAHPDMRGTYEGSGLGLSISSRMANLLGGTIKVESQPGLGTTFVLQIDVDPVGGDGPALNPQAA